MVLGTNEKEKVRELLGRADVGITLFSDKGGAYLDLLKDLSDALGIQVKVESEERGRLKNVDFFPTAVFDEKDNIRFSGIPDGYEFRAFLEAIKMINDGEVNISLQAAKTIQQLKNPTKVLIFTTGSCPHCPSAVTVANKLAFLNSKITVYSINSMEFPDLVEKYEVYAVPKIVVHGKRKVEWEGAVPEETFAKKLVGV